MPLVLRFSKSRIGSVWESTVLPLTVLTGCTGAGSHIKESSVPDTGPCEVGVYSRDLGGGFTNFCEGYCSREISGDLRIGDVGQEELDGLHCLTRVGGNLEFSTNHLTHLGGLRSLVSVGGDLILTGSYLEAEGVKPVGHNRPRYIFRGLPRRGATLGDCHPFSAFRQAFEGGLAFPCLRALAGLWGGCGRPRQRSWNLQLL